MPMDRREFLFRGVGVATVSALVPRFAVAGTRFFGLYIDVSTSRRGSGTFEMPTDVSPLPCAARPVF